MYIWEIVLLSLSLSVDSLVVSISGSVSLGRLRFSRVIYVAAVFAIVQAGLLFFGWLAGVAVAALIHKIAHTIGFVILLYLGGSAIWSAVNSTEDNGRVSLQGIWHLSVAAVATSIDAFAVGASLAMSEVSNDDIAVLVAGVGAVTFAASAFGVRCGSFIGRKFGRPAKLAGGLVLILIGIKLVL